MAVTLELDVSRAALSAAGAVCRRERKLRMALAALLANPRDERAWAAVRTGVQPTEELSLRADLELLAAVAKSGSAGDGLGGSPRTPFTEGESC